MNDQTDSQLLRAYAEHRSEPAFAELVRRHVDFIHSAALRMVCNSHLAEDVAQSVFVALAKNAAQLTHRSVLSGWLHRTAQNIAAQTVRSEVRRRAREHEAAAMNALLATEPDALWANIAPQLDAALGELSEPDRDALLLRYFERKSAREMAQTLGTSEDAAQKRVSRAVERLRESFAKRGIAVGAGGLVVVISANAVQAAPAGLAVTISTVAALAGTTIATTTTATATQIIAMTTLQKAIIGATLVVAVGTGIYEARQAATLRAQVQTLQQQQAPLAAQIQELQHERDVATQQLAALRDDNERLNRNTAELLKLRGETSRLRSDSQALAQLKAGGSHDVTEFAAKSWINRVGQLKQHLEQMPNANIPELQFATEQDWLNAARGELNTEADYRRALSTLRSAGEGTFVPMIQNALKKYMQGNNEQMPTDIVQLKPYFDSPVNDVMLQRWEVATAKTVKSLGLGGDVIITQKAPVDDVFDTRFGIGPNGRGQTEFLSQETREAMGLVFEAFRAAHSGQWQTDLSQLLPYATTPEQQAALEKLMLKKSAGR